MDMKQYLSDYDEAKLKKVIEIKELYNSGKMSLEDARVELKKNVKSLKPHEIALAEQHLKEFEDDECRKENIQQMLELFEGIMDTSRPDLESSHPIMCYYRENDALETLLQSVEDLVQYPVIKNQWYELYEKLNSFKIHLSRKQNQLYSILEQKGFDRPTTTMWTLDNFVRDEIADIRRLLDEGHEEEFIKMQETLVADMRDLMDKENTILYPTSLAMISPEEFESMKQGDREIGFAWIEVEEENKPVEKSKETAKNTADSLGKDLAALLEQHGYASSAQGPLEVAMGKLTLDQINLIYRHMPVDISYVDENEVVQFYTDTEHRVFPRSKNVIGRDVKNCHPRDSVHVVEEIIEKFRSGEEDQAEFWINKPDLFIYIYYVAVRDQEGRFRGVLEMMQDCTHIRNLEGSQTLLSWGSKDDGKGSDREEEPEPAKEAKRSGKWDQPITKDTFIKDVLAEYPDLKEELIRLNGKFKMLNTPLARVMLPKATVEVMSQRSGESVETLIQTIETFIAKS